MSVLGTRVRLKADAVISRLLNPEVEWTGVIEGQYVSKKGNPTKYLVRFDEHLKQYNNPLPNEDTVLEHEIERL